MPLPGLRFVSQLTVFLSIAGGLVDFQVFAFCNASWALHFAIPVNRNLLTDQLGFTWNSVAGFPLYDTVAIPYGRFDCSENWFRLALLLFFLYFPAVMALNIVRFRLPGNRFSFEPFVIHHFWLQALVLSAFYSPALSEDSAFVLFCFHRKAVSASLRIISLQLKKPDGNTTSPPVLLCTWLILFCVLLHFEASVNPLRVWLHNFRCFAFIFTLRFLFWLQHWLSDFSLLFLSENLNSCYPDCSGASVCQSAVCTFLTIYANSGDLLIPCFWFPALSFSLYIAAFSEIANFLPVTVCTLVFLSLAWLWITNQNFTPHHFFSLCILTQEPSYMVFRFTSGLCDSLYWIFRRISIYGLPHGKNFHTTESTCKTGVCITAILNRVPAPKDHAGCLPILCVTSFFFPLLRFLKLVATFSGSYTTDLSYRHLKNACYRGNICSGFRRLTNHFPKILVAVRTCSVNST